MKKTEVLKIVLINLRDLLIVIAVGLCISYYFSNSYKYIINNWERLVLYSAIMGMTIWKGNLFYTKILDKHFSWRKNLRLKLFLTISLLLIYSALSVMLVNMIWSYFTGTLYFGEMISSVFIKRTIIIVIVSFIIGMSINTSYFIKEWRKSIVSEEKKNTEIIALRYEALKNQVNPHFLFNSLTALTTIVADNNDAVKFIKKLSDVYRYVLENREKELVDLESELKFAQAFIYLHKIRFGESLNSESDIDVRNFQILPLYLQMLIENAVKHNIVSEDKPLNIKIYVNDDNYLIVENNLQKKKNTSGSGIGLENIKSRYKYLSDKKFVVKEEKDKFIVKIPLIKNKNESTDN